MTEPGERWAERLWIATPWIFANGLFGVEVAFEDARFTAIACPQHSERLTDVEELHVLLNIEPVVGRGPRPGSHGVPDYFQYSIGDAGATWGMLWTTCLGSLFNTPLEMPSWPVPEPSWRSWSAFNTPLEMPELYRFLKDYGRPVDFQYSIGDALKGLFGVTVHAKLHDFQYSIGDAVPNRAAKRRHI